jgi:hypothetical protein
MAGGTTWGRGALFAALVCAASCRNKSAAGAPVQPSSVPAPSATTAIAVQNPAASEIDGPLPAGSGSPHELTECANADLRACLAPFIKPQLASRDIQGLADAHCFREAGDALAQAGDCLPLRAGTDASNGKVLLFSFVCSDVCPDQGSVSFQYDNVEEAECCKLGGEPRHIWPDSYIGCSPLESAARMGAYRVTPDGKWRHIQSSRCPKRKPIILAEWPCEPPVATRLALGVTTGPLPPGLEYAPHAQIFPESSCLPRFDAAVAERALSKFDQPALKCLTSHRPGQAVIRIQFVPSGNVHAAYLSEPSWLNGAQARCIESIFHKATIAPFGRDTIGELFHGLVLE